MEAILYQIERRVIGEQEEERTGVDQYRGRLPRQREAPQVAKNNEKVSEDEDIAAGKQLQTSELLLSHFTRRFPTFGIADYQ